MLCVAGDKHTISQATGPSVINQCFAVVAFWNVLEFMACKGAWERVNCQQLYQGLTCAAICFHILLPEHFASSSHVDGWASILN